MKWGFEAKDRKVDEIIFWGKNPTEVKMQRILGILTLPLAKRNPGK